MSGEAPRVITRNAHRNDLDDVMYLIEMMLAAEREDTPILPDLSRKRYSSLRKQVAKTIGFGHGAVAEVDGDIDAFLIFDSLVMSEGSGLLTTSSWLEFNAFRAMTADETLPSLLTHTMERLAAKGVQEFRITTWSHGPANQILQEFGFGVHDASGIAETKRTMEAPVPNGITIERHVGSDNEHLRPLRNALVEHQSGSPMFITRRSLTARQWAAHNRHNHPWFFVACAGETPVGYIEIDVNGQDLVEEANEVQSIRSLAVDPEWRGTGLEEALVATLLGDLTERGWTLGTADYLTADPDARRIFSLFFREYARTFVRRIDARGDAMRP